MGTAGTLHANQSIGHCRRIGCQLEICRRFEVRDKEVGFGRIQTYGLRRETLIHPGQSLPNSKKVVVHQGEIVCVIGCDQ